MLATLTSCAETVATVLGISVTPGKGAAPARQSVGRPELERLFPEILRRDLPPKQA